MQRKSGTCCATSETISVFSKKLSSMKFEDKVKWLREKKYKGRETEEFLHDVKRVANGEAVEYLVGQVDFCGAKIDLSLHPMIPRPETEHWVRGLIEEIKKCESAYTIRVLDLFSGSGCVGLAILKNIPETYVDMIELDPKLKEQIEISVDRNVIRRTRARVVTGDTWEGASSRYDYITAVPPYVPPSMKEEVMKELHQEAPLSFFDKEDGYFYHKQVLSRAKEFLKEGGVAYLEFDTTQRTEIESLAQGYGWENYSFLKDPYGNECVIRLVK